ncbi:acetate kinase [Pestalotiopsis fici W106-1]|uniref:Probable acetate kinase n=1 Tax=Pestalotiopsis fici (strain W106-1 / CGMCC3.15140) TaxID=1229662 RepID=W3XNS0_PESFW|nr:acetate kinase [Pestalotiopsis fici W106-1]ETS87703.1 acetate kinase [Pestalotiopsis fici W106-1]
MKIILSINAGSSSVKISAYTAEQRGKAPAQIAEAQLSGLTSPPAKLKYSRGSEVVLKDEKVADAETVKTQDDAFRVLLRTLVEDPKLGEIGKAEDVAIACHRVVHGGSYAAAQLITEDTYHRLEALTDLAPLHNAPALEIIKSCVKALPSAVNVACFDSQFHASLPEHVRTYPIDPEIARKNQLRKYGFHGISYQFITNSVAEFLGKPTNELNIIALHLGSGASACAIRGGKSWDTSMGLTPLAGLPGATRSGSVDPSLVFHYASDVGKLSPSSTKELHISRAEEILNKESGWRALTGTTDFGTIVAAATERQEPRSRLALDLFADRVCGYVGSYYVSLAGRVDALVFAGGIGEKSDVLRRRVVDQVACLGFALDEDRNALPVEDVVQDIGREGAKHRTLVCQTDEQFEMARSCAADQELWK